MNLDTPNPTPNERRREKLRQRVTFLLAGGLKPGEIAWRVGLTRDEVRSFCRAAPPPPDVFDGYGVNAMWSMPADQRRLAFHARAQQGARAALAGLRSS